MTIRDPYADRLRERIDGVIPGLSASLSRIDAFDPAPAVEALGIVLSHACQATHEGAIMAGRRMAAAMPPRWFAANLNAGILSARLNLDDDWEYRRLLELLEQVQPELMPPLLQRGLASPDRDVREAAEDYLSGRHQPLPPLS